MRVIVCVCVCVCLCIYYYIKRARDDNEKTVKVVRAV